MLAELNKFTVYNQAIYSKELFNYKTLAITIPNTLSPVFKLTIILA